MTERHPQAGEWPGEWWKADYQAVTEVIADKWTMRSEVRRLSAVMPLPQLQEPGFYSLMRLRLLTELVPEIA